MLTGGPLKIERYPQRLVQFRLFGRGKVTGKPGQHRFRQAHQFVAVDAGFVLQTLRNTHRYLRAQAVMTGINGSADDRGKA